MPPKHKKLKPVRFVTHSHKVAAMARRYGWQPGARYTNLRDVRRFSEIGFLDIDWKNYNFKMHLEAAKTTEPFMTVAQDIENRRDLPRVIDQAWELLLYSRHVVIVPKDARLADEIEAVIPEEFILGYSVPTKYGKTSICPKRFKRPVHLLGGRPDVQRKLAESMNVFSFDCNRFTLDATYGDYFDGETFRPHPIGGYERCVTDSIKNINSLWQGYGLLGRQKNEWR